MPAQPAWSAGDFKKRTKGIGPIKGMSFSGDGRLLALGGEDGWIEVWEWPAMKRLRRWQASDKAVRNVDFSPAHNDGVLFSCDEAGACRLWDAAAGEEIAQLAPPPGGCFRLACRPCCCLLLWPALQPCPAGLRWTPQQCLLPIPACMLAVLAAAAGATPSLTPYVLPLVLPLVQTCRGPPSSAASRPSMRMASCCTPP